MSPSSATVSPPPSNPPSSQADGVALTLTMSGGPDVDDRINAARQAAERLADALGVPVKYTAEVSRRCDACGSQSRPFASYADAVKATDADGWAMDGDSDLCPECDPVAAFEVCPLADCEADADHYHRQGGQPDVFWPCDCDGDHGAAFGCTECYAPRPIGPGRLRAIPERMPRAEQVEHVLDAPVPLCPNCSHGMDPHGSDPGGPCGVGGCVCVLTPSAIHHLLVGDDKLPELDPSDAKPGQLHLITRRARVKRVEQVGDLVAIEYDGAPTVRFLPETEGLALYQLDDD